jgi:hypothetical protein
MRKAASDGGLFLLVSGDKVFVCFVRHASRAPAAGNEVRAMALGRG